ncbi:unnamed protein product [Medioppia subpectinata]|uniref:Zinc finger Ran-binding domain-containing protein 2 n=1 Tax=Medioppia subpectinata TaxID=1979941 RepID=A0A7R9L258_9ACAR|nr:unnamed protein product [Medioppia subpectinata]CAG2112926.1 unnamed protein product [Medioppia subpectinata]
MGGLTAGQTREAIEEYNVLILRVMSVPKSATGQSFRISEGDWICDDQNCQNVNFARRMTCNICGKDKPLDSRLRDKEADKASAEKKRKVGHEIGKVAAEKSKGLFSADDWQCGRCGNVNWARRHTCNMCSAPKFSDNEERTGLGGGYNEREEVEYVERQDSDGEYDDFGRKRKKTRTSDDRNPISDDKETDSSQCKSDVNSCHNNREDDAEDEEEEDDDDDESGDVSKYKLESEEEDEEDDDDDDEDLSKYDLSDCLEDKK